MDNGAWINFFLFRPIQKNVVCCSVSTFRSVNILTFLIVNIHRHTHNTHTYMHTHTYIHAYIHRQVQRYVLIVSHGIDISVERLLTVQQGERTDKWTDEWTNKQVDDRATKNRTKKRIATVPWGRNTETDCPGQVIEG